VDLLSELRTIVVEEDRVRADPAETERHGRAFFTYLAPHTPDAVVFPKSRDEVAEILRFADG
jgi:D-lactate dehydrogenase (cytochrome)